MKQRLISILILVTMLFTLLPVEAITVMANNGNTVVNTVQEKEKNKNPFKDVREGSWYYDAVLYARINGFFNGTSENTFDPGGTMSRGMFVTVLSRMAGVDPSAYTGQPAFSDVSADAWYAPFVAWASKHGITSGVGNGKFDPNGLINREQMAVFFVRYFEAFGVNYDTGANITTVPADLDTVSPWAREMVLKLWKTGLLAGDGVNFDPTSNASRAQAATLCMRTDKAVETWYSEPGVPSGRVSVDPDAEQKPETSHSSTGDSGSETGTGGSSNGSNTSGSGSGTDTGGSDDGTETGGSDGGTDTGGSDDGTETGGSDGGSKTTYYKVEFVIDNDSKTEKLYVQGTLLSTMPNPAQPTGKVFLGWYHDTEKSKPVNNDDKLTGNTTLYAKFTDAAELEEGGAPNFVSALDQASNFSIPVKKTDSAPILGTDFKFRNITAPDKTPERSVAPEDMANIDTVKVEGSNGVWTISSASGGFTPGHTYQIELLDDNVTYDDSAVAIADFKAAYGRENVDKVRSFNFSIEKNGTLNLKLDDGIKYIPVDELSEADGVNLMEYAGLYLASTDSEGNTTYTANNGSGSFTYTISEDIQVGDTVAVYSGTKPTERLPEKGTENKTDNDGISYVKITRIDGSTYHYVAAEAEDVIFTPDVLPIDVDKNDGTTGWTQNGTWVVIDNSKLYFSAIKYESMGLSSETTVDVGDFLAFYTGDFGDVNAQDKAYGEITDIIINEDGTTTITYTEISDNKVMSAMDLYDETQISQAELQSIVDKNKDEIQRIIEAQLIESGFFEDAGEYLAELALHTDEVREVFGDGLTMTDCTVTFADGTPLGADALELMGNIIDNDQDGKKPKVSVSITPRLSHFAQNLAGTGLRVEVAVNYQFKIQKKGNNNIMEVDLTAFFEQEFTIGFNVSGGAVWKWKWIFPYIADYRMNGNLDIGTYTGIGITATAKLTQDKEPWGMPWPNSAKEAAATKKIFSLSQSIKDAMEEVEKIIPEAEATASGGLAEKYAQFMEDANEEWVDLITVKLINLHSAVDPLHILAYGLQVDFVVSANLNVAIGMTFQYENFKRHSFTLSVKSKKGQSETIDLSTNGYQFDFYVMGTIGIRAGIRTKVTVGLFSTKLAGIGLQFEAGAYVRMWGYFYYHLENWKIKGVWQKNSSHSGALLIEIGAYLDVKFIAEALNGKYSYAPSIYAKEWPFWTAGQQKNVYDFAYEENPTFNILNVTTYTLPKNVFDMVWMDLKTGELEEDFENLTDNFDSDTAPDGDDEARFAVELSSPAFSYNPVNNQITINTAPDVLTQSCEMKLTWKDAPLSYSSEVLSRTIKLNWTNEANAGTIAFDSNGGSTVPMLRLLAGTAIGDKMPAAPARLGYTFAGWYIDKAFNNAFTATTIPKGNTTLYAKWEPNTVGYTVEHYQPLNGQYVLIETDKTPMGKVGERTAAVTRPYTGFTAQPIRQQTIAHDGSTRVAIYYSRSLYDLKFVYGNGSNDLTLRVPYGSSIVKPSNPTKQGYTFAGWNTTIPDTMPAHALTFTAEWTANTNTPYIVKHYKQNMYGTYVLDQTEGKSGTTGQDTSTAAKTYTGFTAQEFAQKTIAPQGNTVVEIRYDRNLYNLSWNVNGGSPLTGTYTSGNVKYGTTIMKPVPPTRTGHTFAGWYREAELTTALEPYATMPATDVTLHARWDTNKYNIYFNNNYGSYVPPITQIYGTAVTAPTAPIRKGYTFAGWKLNGADYTFSTMPAGNITLTAVWTVNQYTITFDSNNGSSVSPITQDYGTAVTAPTAPTRQGYAFAGWKINGASYMFNTMPAENITLTAAWTADRNTPYQVEHYLEEVDGSYATTPIETENLIGITAATVYTTPKYYQGFTYDSKVNGTVSSGTVAGDGTLVLKLYYTRNDYTVTWDGNGGTMDTHGVITNSVKYGSPITKPTNNPAKIGYILNQWSGYTENMTMPAQNITFIADWTADTNTPYRVEHYLQELDGSYPVTPGETENLTGTTGVTVNATAKSYPGFSYDSKVSGTVAIGAVAADGTLVLKLYYTRRHYTVTWDGNGAAVDTNGATTGSVKYGASISKPTNNPAKTGYTFSQWSGYTENMTMPYENTTFTADWIADRNIPYKVEHYLEEVDGRYPATPNETDNLTGTTGTTVNATAKSYTGFSYSSDVDGTVSSGIVTGDGSLALKMYYTRNDYSVTWNGNGGTVDNNEATTDSVKYGAIIIKPTNNPAKTGYTFSQWSGYTENMIMPAADTTFTADWTINQYTITFDSDGGSEVAALTQDYGSVVTEPTAPTRKNHTFVGWQLDGTDYVFTTMPAKNIKLAAVWSSTPSYAVSFDANGGTVDTDPKFVFTGRPYGDLPVPINGEQLFLGWFMEASDRTKVTSETNVVLSEDHTLYARWATRYFTGEVNEKVELYVAGIKVTTGNMNDILGDGSASVQFDPNTTTFWDSGSIETAGTLYLNDATIAGTYSTYHYSNYHLSAAIYCRGSLTIVNTGTSTVTNTYNETGTRDDVVGIFTNSALVIEGTGTLTVTSGTGGTKFNCGIRAGSGGNYLTIEGPTVKVFGGTAGSGGKSYGVCVGWLDDLVYTVILRKGTLETRGHDYAAYCGPREHEIKYFITDGYRQKFDTITVSTSYDGTSPFSVTQNETYQDYKYITVENYTLWPPYTYSVVYDPNGGSGSMQDQTFTYRSANSLTTNAFTRTGYTFIGWNTKADGSGTSYADGHRVVNLSDVPNGTFTLYAQWIEDTVTLYDLWVGGNLVTSNNASDVLGDGKISYNPTTNTLTLNNATITEGYTDYNNWGAGIYAKGALNIRLMGENFVDVSVEDGLGRLIGINSKSVILSGDKLSDSLTMIISDEYTDYCYGILSNAVNITNCTVTAESNIGITGSSGVTIENAVVTGIGYSCGIGAGYDSFQIINSTVTARVLGDGMAMSEAPELTGYTDLQVTVSTDASGTPTIPYDAKNIASYKYINITETPYTTYDIWVHAVQIDSTNRADVLKNGTVSYNRDTNTLTLNNATITAVYTDQYSNNAGIYTKGDLNIRLIGTNKVDISGKEGLSRANGILSLAGGLSFFGDDLNDSLTVSSSNVQNEFSLGISATDLSKGAINIINCTVSAKSGDSSGNDNHLCAGIFGGKGIKIDNAAVTGNGGSSTNNSNCGIGLEWGSIEIIDSTVTASVYGNGMAMNIVPELNGYAGGVMVKASTNYDGSSPTTYNANHNEDYKYITIADAIHYDIWVQGIQITEINIDDVLGDGTISYDETTNTLTLNGANLSYHSSETEVNAGVIYSKGDLIIELADDSTNTLTNNSESVQYKETCGIYVVGDLTITGTGAINAIGGTGYTSQGIATYGSLTIENGTVNAIGRSAEFVIAISSSNVFTINGGTVTVIAEEATQGSYGFYNNSSWGRIFVNGGTVVVAGETCAMLTSPIATEMKITASTKSDGTYPTEKYDSASIQTYRYIKIEPES